MSKKPVLYLHIGSPKTGTTALQECLAKNQNFLMQNKICYPPYRKGHYKISNAHSDLSRAIMSEYLERNDVVDLKRYEPPISVICNVKNIFKENNSNTLILSCESLFETSGFIEWFPDSAYTKPLILGRRKYTMEYFKETFKEFNIKIVCYLRRQDDYIESLYNQIGKKPCNVYNEFLYFPENAFGKREIRGGASCDVSFLNKLLNVRFIDYYKNLCQWAEIYGKENIIVRPYEKSQLPNGIEYDFFTNVLGFKSDLLTELDLYKEVNVSFNKDIIEYKLAAHPFDMKNELEELNNSPALDYLKQNNKKNILTARQADEILEYYKVGNEKIAREYLNREDGILFYEKRREEKDDYTGLSLQAAIDISRELALIQKNKEQQIKSECDIIKKKLETANSSIKSLKKELDIKNIRVSSLKKELDIKNTRVSSLKKELGGKQAEIDNLHRSTSWKVTKPLRVVKRLITKK